MTKLKAILKEKGLRQYELASKAGVSRENVTMQVKKGVKTTRVATRYAKILGCSPVELLDF